MQLSVMMLFMFSVFLLSGCGGNELKDIKQESSASETVAPVERAVIDTDGDGIKDEDDLWPVDPTQPAQSALWGAYGEKWSRDSRLPLVVFAGYREGEALPDTDSFRVVANVLDFGATSTEGSSNDTQAFLDAINAASTKVDAQHPGVIYVPAGVYDIDEQLHLNKSGLVLKGAGRDMTTLRFTKGLIDSANSIGDNKRRRKLIVMGGNNDADANFRAGKNWEQWDSDFSAALDVDRLPSRGALSVTLKNPISDTLRDKISAQNFRIRLAQYMNYGESSVTPKLAASIYGGDDFASVGSDGGILVSQQFVVTIDQDNKTLHLDRPIRFSPSDEQLYGGARIAVRDMSESWETEEIAVEAMTIRLPSTDWLDHYGTEGQGGIEVMSDNSWVREVTIINADNGIEIDKDTFNSELSDIILEADRVPRRSGPTGSRYDAYGHHGITVKGRDHKVSNVELKVSFVHDITMNNSHGSVIMNAKANFMNMDHHRQGIYSNVWTEIQLGNPKRMWESTGNPSEGYNSSAYNTFWNIRSDAPELAYWPEDGTVDYPQWGYHMINVIGTDITRKPDIAEGNRPYPYNPDNAHLEVIKQDDLWPKNLYQAQVDAYKKGLLW